MKKGKGDRAFCRKGRSHFFEAQMNGDGWGGMKDDLSVLGLTHGAQKPGFCENTSLPPTDSVKNPVSSVGVSKSCITYSRALVRCYPI